MSNTVDILIRTQAQLGALQSLVSTWLPRLISLGVAYKALNLVKDQIDFADAMGKSAQKAGVLVEKFSALHLAAELSDLGTQELVVAFKGLNDWMEKTGRATEDNVEVLLETAELFERMPDGVQKTNMAVERFGRAGLNMIPMLNQGRDAIEKLMARAKELGLVFTKEQAAAAEEFNDQLTILRKTGEGVLNNVLKPMLPVLVDLAKAANKLAESWSDSEAEPFIKGAQRGFFGSLYDAWNADSLPLAFRPGAGLAKPNWQNLTGGPTDKGPIPADDSTNRNIHLRAIRSAQVGAQGGDLADQLRNEIVNLEQAKKELEGKFTEMFVPGTTETRYTAAFAEVADQWYGLKDEITQVEQAITDVVRGEEEERRRIRDATMEATIGIFGNLAHAASAFGKEGFAAFKAFALAEAIIATYSSGVKAYDATVGIPYVGPALAPAAAAAAVAAGLANVATIAGTSYGGAREYGGPVEPGKMYLTGERGREFFVPDQRGSIIPAGLTERMLAGNLAPNFTAAAPNITVKSPPVIMVNSERELFRRAMNYPEFTDAILETWRQHKLQFGQTT